MIRYTVFIASLLILFHCTAFSQTRDTLFFDDFNDLSKSWALNNTAENSITISNGSMHWTYLPQGAYFTWKTFEQLSYKKDFTIKVSYRPKKSGGYGISFGVKDVDNAHFFYVRNGTDFVIGHYAAGTKIIRKTATSTAISPAFNILSIKQVSGTMQYYVNTTKVWEEKTPAAYGTKCGLMIYGTAIVDIDYYFIKQEMKEIHLASGIKYESAPENLGTAVNTKYSELTPVVTPDGKGLYFARSYSPDNIGGVKDYSDIWYSEFKNGQWGTAVNIGKPLNNSSPNTVMSVTPDGNNIFLLNKYTFKGEYLDDGFSISERSNNGWSNPKNLLIYGFYDLNEYLEGYLCNDGKTLLITTEQTDSYGDKDIYVSFLRADGTWSKLVNLGNTVNTSASEIYPFLAADGKTLYFSSKGHPGYGSADIFVTKRLDDSWTKWSEPLNLGKPVNTEGWDAYYSVPASGDYAYMIKYDNSIGEGDVVRIKLPATVKPDPVVLIKGKVYDANTKLPLGSKIFYESLSTHAEAGMAQSNPTTGDYQIILPYGDMYGFRAEAPNHFSVSDNIDVTVKKEYIEITRDLYLVPIQVGSVIQMNNVFFERSKPVLLPISYPELDRLVKMMTENSAMEIELLGHTDNAGSPKMNMELSEQRVIAVKDYLVSKGISGKRITGKGYGGTKPVAPNDTEEHMAKNRRVEFKIVKFE